MEAKHTPGPWKWGCTDDGHEIRMGTALASFGTWESQHLIEYNHEIFQDEDEDDGDPSPETRQYKEAEANARLIAAAPELLAACQAFLELFRKSDMFPEDECHDLYNVMEDAIAKATGATL